MTLDILKPEAMSTETGGKCIETDDSLVEVVAAVEMGEEVVVVALSSRTDESLVEVVDAAVIGEVVVAGQMNLSPFIL